MKKYKNFKKSGRFNFAGSIELLGDLTLSAGATSLDLYSKELINVYENRDIFGIFHDLSKVSLINCVRMQGGSGWRGNDTYNFAKVFPHFALFGEEHIESGDRKITEVSFVVDDAPCLFHDFQAFGSVIGARYYMEQIAASRDGRPSIEIGEYPSLFYFTGKHEIFIANTVIGKVSATHSVSYAAPGPEGINVNNTIRLNIACGAPQTIDETIAHVIGILNFLGVIAGRPQNVLELSFQIGNDNEGRPKSLDAYWCMPPGRDNDDESKKPHPFDLPIQAGKNPDMFGGILSRWLDRYQDWRGARSRYATAMAYQHRYEIDRLVGAANMFDILPGGIFPPSVPLAIELAAARDAARAAFKALPPTPERNSVLNALGRIGKPALKQKIRSRAKLITDRVGARFPELELVIDQAVDCRNYFVHGSPGKFDYSAHTEQLGFFTDAFEFVFAASDLIDAGWNITAWMNEGTTLSHPFGRFKVNYGFQLAALKVLLSL